jgi:hypothetical protein
LGEKAKAPDPEKAKTESELNGIFIKVVAYVLD